MPQRKTFIFTHVPKVAGTSLMERLLYQNFDRKDLRQFRGIKDLAIKRTSHQVLVGHNPFGMGDFIPGPSLYFTMFRDPVARAISHYYFIRQPALDPAKGGNPVQKILHRSVRLKDIFEKTRHQRWRPATSWLVDNLQTRYTTGYRHNWRSENSSHLLKTAKKNLRDKYHVFGIQERFEDALTAIGNSFGWTVGPPTERFQTTRIEKDYDEEDPNTVRRYHQLDQERYEYACELFDERFGPNIPGDSSKGGPK